jgi:diguanylate cyclase (GGDEF)-like protein
MLSRIKQLLLLTETHLNSPSATVLQQSALRIILTSGLLLVLTIVLHSSWQAYQAGAWYTIAITTSFYAILLLALYFSTHHLAISRVILLFTVFSAGLCMLFFIDNFELSKLGVIFVYTAPLIALLFFNRTVTLLVMAINVLPFLFILYSDTPVNLFNFSITLPATHTYLHSLLFLFFNLCIPLTIMRMLSTLNRNAAVLKAQNANIMESHQLYQDIFNHHSKATLLVTAGGHILKANAKAQQTLALTNAEHRHLTEVISTTLQDKPEFWLGHDTECQLLADNSKHLLLNHLCSTQQQHHLLQLDDITPLKLMHKKLAASEQQHELWHNYDTLTSLPNAGFLLSLIHRQRESTVAGLMLIIRLCHVKAFNHQNSYQAGDELLTTFAQQLQNTLPEQVMFGRLRGVKFVLWTDLLHSSSSVSEQVTQLRNLLPAELKLSAGSIKPMYEIGVSIATSNNLSAEEMLEQCESALELADAYNCPVAYYQADSLQQRNLDLQLLADLKQALHKDELTLWLQPKVTPDGTIQSFEALLRWPRADGSFVSPETIIRLAEQYGLIGEVSSKVLNQAVTILGQFRAIALKYPVAINLAGSDLLVNTFYNALIDVATHQPTLLSQLTLELTENSIISHKQPLFDKIHALKKLGFSIALDDFGTGQASLSMLSKLPVDKIKLDRSFLKEIPHNPVQVRLVQSVIQLAAALQLKLVIEGIETDIQRRFLIKLGCKQMQGYFFAKPAPVAYWLKQLKAVRVNRAVTL